MAVFIPFNFEPISTTIKTSSYAIPSGRYARVKPFFLDSVSFDTSATVFTISDPHTASLNGVVVAVSTIVATYINATDVAITLPSYDMLARIQAGYTSGTLTYKIRTIKTFSFSADGGLTAQVNGGSLVVSGGSLSSMLITLEPNPAVHLFEPFWVKEGDTLAGTGSYRWLVEEYYKIT